MTNLPNIGKPATNALQNIGVTTLEQVAAMDEPTLLKIHGVGPKAIKILREALTEQGMGFQSGESLSKDFAVICDFECDNAPKKRMIRDYLIASATANQADLEAVLEEDFVWTVPGEFQIEGRQEFIEELVAHAQPISTLEIQSLLTHGKGGSAHGTVTDKRGKKVYFSDIFVFRSSGKDAKISGLTSFVVIED
ncbi:nuclear transport factor 2 family protein [Listeria riparia]|uniref:DNA-binding domain-containing protein n=1 Tax=Listeria riparia FSL S10-1204 TaxID=1265816 RepID=W7DE09_9LIST|nr:nuclear transport factor 2 family protein [Listeria riparia]EUJ43558.1 DNA-binding domain-containing protein [Listeria riparia FSL S10-1204]